MNKVELMGRLTKDVEKLTTQNKKEMARFTLAIPRKMSKEDVDFIDCIAFGNLVDVLSKYVQKGNRIIVCGQIQTSTYKDKDGNNKKSTYILVDDFYFVEYKKELNNDQLEIPSM